MKGYYKYSMAIGFITIITIINVGTWSPKKYEFCIILYIFGII